MFSGAQNVESNITVDELAMQNANNILLENQSVQNDIEQSKNNVIKNNVINEQNEVPTSGEINQNENLEKEADEVTDILNNEEETSETNAESNEPTEIIENTEENIPNEETLNTSSEPETEVIKKPVTFSKPVEGEIIKPFAKDNLVYSETLLEWTTHFGIDIKADKTTVVKSAADGIVQSIKNDPRYGLTVIVEHEEGYKTIYSNLLSTEFVVEGEEVSQGQSLGTVGNTAIFEISDTTHLHFELLRNGEYLDPTIFIK